MFDSTRLLSVNPLVGYMDAFVDAAALDILDAHLHQLKLGPAKVSGAQGPVEEDKRVALMHKIHPGQIREIDDLQARVAAVFRLKREFCEYPEFISYDVGGEFKRHFDGALRGAMPSPDPDKYEPSQRVFTAVLYLNDDFSGGNTLFPRLDIMIEPMRGRLVFWQNTKIGTFKVHPMSMHQGAPVKAGNKRILSFWFRDRPWGPVHF